MLLRRSPERLLVRQTTEEPEPALAYGLPSSVRLAMVRRLAAASRWSTSTITALAYDLPPEYFAAVRQESPRDVQLEVRHGVGSFR